MQTPFVLPDAVPGQISIWSGAIVNIPTGWALCDGTQGTPDLRDKFTVGAGDTYAVDDTGGSATHNHFFLGGPHNHGKIPPPGTIGAGTVDGKISAGGVIGTSDAGSTLAPYYSLAYIMFL